jgi:nucleoside-diphosphate-sugar epimerase
MKILITGASGFIGSSLYKHFEKSRENTLYGIDKIDNNELSNFTKIDIRDFDVLSKYITIQEPDIIIHCAARTDMDGDSIKDYDSNTLGTCNVVMSCELVKKHKPVLLSFSSMLVCSRGHLPKNNDDYSASTYYGTSKVISELYTRQYTGDHFLIRPTSIWGPGFKAPYRSFFEIVLAGKFLAPKPQKLAVKSYGYIENVNLQIEYLIKNIDIFKKNNIIYLLDDKSYSIGDWADEISVLVRNKKYIRIPFKAFKIAASFGDLLTFTKVNFPISTFRFKNMTIDHVVPHDERFEDLKDLYISRFEAVKRTLKWLGK